MDPLETTPTPDRPCQSCGAALAPAQDWCLECGTAAPGAFSGRGSRNGLRAAATIISTVVLLVGGAVAASYAALNSEAEMAASLPAPPSAAPTVPTTPSTTTTPAPTPPPAPQPAPEPTPEPEPPAPEPTSDPAPPAPDPEPEPEPDPEPDPNAHTPLDLGVAIASVYDPYDAAIDSTDPSDSYDRNGKTVFTLTTAARTEEEGDEPAAMGAGLAFDLERRQEVERVYFRTTTPGFTVEVYGAKHGLPPDILDTRWKLLETAKDAGSDKGADGLEKIEFDPGEYTHIVLWFTTPPPSDDPAADPTVGISEVRIID